MKMSKYLYTILLVAMCSCDFADDRMKVYNSCNDSLYVNFEIKEGVDNKSNVGVIISPRDTVRFDLINTSWDYIAENNDSVTFAYTNDFYKKGSIPYPSGELRKKTFDTDYVVERFFIEAQCDKVVSP